MNAASKILTAGVGTIALITLSLIPQPAPAMAPTMVGTALASQRALGYEPCEPVLSQLPAFLAEQGVIADAAPTPMFAACEIRFAVGTEVPAAADLDWVAWHEVCHLSTIPAIYADAASAEMEDPAHEHQLFLACLNHGPTERGGY